MIILFSLCNYLNIIMKINSDLYIDIQHYSFNKMDRIHKIYAGETNM